MKTVDEATWRSRFITMQLTRIGGTIVSLVAVYIMLSDLVAPGGSILLGLPLALAGLVVSFWGPKYLSRKWRRDDGR